MQHNNWDKWDFETFEHLVPLSKGGANAPPNVALAHYRCNQQRGAQEREPLLLRVARS